jgi:hypothetical protein
MCIRHYSDATAHNQQGPPPPKVPEGWKAVWNCTFPSPHHARGARGVETGDSGSSSTQHCVPKALWTRYPTNTVAAVSQFDASCILARLKTCLTMTHSAVQRVLLRKHPHQAVAMGQANRARISTGRSPSFWCAARLCACRR